MLEIKSDRLFNATSSLIISIGLIISGTLLIIFKGDLYYQLVQIFILAILFSSIKQFVNYFLGKKKDKKMNFTKCFLNLLFCLILSFFQNIPLSIIPLIFGGYLLVNGLVKLINYIILLKNKTNGRLFELFSSIFYLGISLPMVLSPIKNIDIIIFLLGCYFLLLGLNYLGDFITFLIPKKWKNKIKRRFRVSLPAFIEAIIPFTVLSEINYLIDKESYENPFVFTKEKESDKPDMEVFVHTSNRGFNRMGHVDLYYQGKVISYGNYDDSSIRFFDMIGDGVVFTTNRDKYIPFCIEHSAKTLFVFGLKLTDEQKRNIDKELDKLFSQLQEWKPPYVEALSKSKKLNKEYDDDASVLYQNTGAKFYKFNSGRFQKYFVLGANCCRLADLIIGKSGIDLLKMNGIITPGTYYEYLNREYQKKNSIVVSRNIYNEKAKDKKSAQKIIKGFSK